MIHQLRTIAEQFDVNPGKHQALWTCYTWYRNDHIRYFLNNGLIFDDAYADSVNTFKSAIENDPEDEKERKIWIAVSNIDWIPKDTSDYREYEGIFKKDTGFEIKYLSLELNLLDEDNVIVDSVFADSVSNISNGQKAKISFYTYEEFYSYQVIVTCKY